jgi:hypothetical protein
MTQSDIVTVLKHAGFKNIRKRTTERKVDADLHGRRYFGLWIKPFDINTKPCTLINQLETSMDIIYDYWTEII